MKKNLWLLDQDIKFTLGISIFGVARLTKSLDPGKYFYS